MPKNVAQSIKGHYRIFDRQGNEWVANIDGYVWRAEHFDPWSNRHQVETAVTLPELAEQIAAL